jgi:transketolase C-terminal domain/subunit
MITVTGQKDTRSGFGDGIVEIARTNPQIVALTADLAGSLKLNQFIKEFPDRFFQCGIAEANMMSIAAGMTIGGKIPFTTTFANFSTGRVYDQIRQSVAYSGKNVKICASHAGLTLGEDGATHQILEDIGMMKMLPGMTVIVPCDTEAVLKSIQKTGCAVSAEEHNIIGGMGDSIAHTASKASPVPIEYVGTNDTFGESGTPAQLLEKYGLDAAHIVAAAEKVIARKNK